MFRRKKYAGTVTVFDDDEDSNARPRDDEATRASEQQMEAVALATAQAGKDSTARALLMAEETREIGVATAETMRNQTERLEKMSEDIEVVHDYLDKSERMLRTTFAVLCIRSSCSSVLHLLSMSLNVEY